EVLGEAQGPDLVRGPVDPDGALAAARRVVDPGHEVPGEPPAVDADTDAGAPPPLGLAAVIARGVVDRRESVDRARGPAVESQRPGRGDPGLLARPGLRAAVRTARLEPRFLAELEVELDAAVADPQHARDRPVGTPRDQLHLAAPRHEPRPLAVVARGARLARQVERPEGLPAGPDLDLRRARHQVVGEDADPAPALQRAAAVEEAPPGQEGVGRDAHRRRLCRYALRC